MSKIHAVTPEEATFASSVDGKGIAHSVGSLDGLTYFAPGEHQLTLTAVHKHPPVTPPLPHAHSEDEIMYVLEGELILGKRHYGPGSAVYVPANTLYSFSYGEAGVRYLNIRAGAADHITREQFVARHREVAVVEVPDA